MTHFGAFLPNAVAILVPKNYLHRSCTKNCAKIGAEVNFINQFAECVSPTFLLKAYSILLVNVFELSAIFWCILPNTVAIKVHKNTQNLLCFHTKLFGKINRERVHYNKVTF